MQLVVRADTMDLSCDGINCRLETPIVTQPVKLVFYNPKHHFDGKVGSLALETSRLAEFDVVRPHVMCDPPPKDRIFLANLVWISVPKKKQLISTHSWSSGVNS